MRPSPQIQQQYPRSFSRNVNTGLKPNQIHKDRDGASVVSNKSAPSITSRRQHVNVIEDDDHHPAPVSSSDAILYSPQTFLQRNHSGTDLDHLLNEPSPTIPRASSAPKPRPSPFALALHTEETKNQVKIEMEMELEMMKTLPYENHFPVRPLTQPNFVEDDHDEHAENQEIPVFHHHVPTQGDHKDHSAKPKANKKPVNPQGFTAEQLSEYKARKRAVLAVGSQNGAPTKVPSNIPGQARYAAPTMAAFIRNKEQSAVVMAKKGGSPAHVKAPIAPNARHESPVRRLVANDQQPVRLHSSPVRRAPSTEQVPIPPHRAAQGKTTMPPPPPRVMPSSGNSVHSHETSKSGSVKSGHSNSRHEKLDAHKVLSIVHETDKHQRHHARAAHGHSGHNAAHHENMISDATQTSRPMSRQQSFDHLLESSAENSNLLNISFDERVETPKFDYRVSYIDICVLPFLKFMLFLVSKKHGNGY